MPIVLVLSAIGISLQVYNRPPRISEETVFTHYNNYLIFKNSFFHLLEGLNLYTAYPSEVWDLYKYSPAFSLFMGIMAWMPDWAGLIFWNLLNVMVLYFGVNNFDFKSNRIQLFFWFFVFLELLTSMQNSQCNIMIIGLFMLAYKAFSREQVGKAALFLTLTVFIKLFGIVAFSLFLIYPKKIKFLLYSAMYLILFAFIPVVITGWDGLIWQYQNWWEMLANDHSASSGLSVIGWIESWFGLSPNKMIIVGVGALLFLLPLLNFSAYKDSRFRAMLLASASLWVVIFNHKAESATFIIAVVAAYIWFSHSKRGWLEIGLLIFCFIFTVLSPTDLFPRVWRDGFVVPYVMKAVPCIFIWIAVVIDMIRLRVENKTSEAVADLI